MTQKDFDPQTMTRATRRDVFRMYVRLWGWRALATLFEDEHKGEIMSGYNGYTKTTGRDGQLTGLIAACREFLADNPHNEYWKKILLHAEIEQEARRVAEWLDGYELPQCPPVEWLEEVYLDHLEWVGEQDTRRQPA